MTTHKPPFTPSPKSHPEGRCQNFEIAPCPALTESPWFERYTQLTMPPGALAQICEPILRIMAAREKKRKTSVSLLTDSNQCEPHKTLQCEAFLFAGDHAVAHEEGVSAFPQIVTSKMLGNFVNGGAAMSLLAEQRKITLNIVDAGSLNSTLLTPKVHHTTFADWRQEFNFALSVTPKYYEHGAKNIKKEDALLFDHHMWLFEKACNFVANTVTKKKLDLVIIGEMGIGNTTAASALSMVILNELSSNKVTGSGTGLNLHQRRIKEQVVKDAVTRWQACYPQASAEFCNACDISHGPLSKSATHQLLAGLGGFEISCMAGAALGAAKSGAAVLLDGFICSSAITPVAMAYPNMVSWLIAGHESAEPGHALLLQRLGLSPLLRLNLRLGEGSGAAIALGLLQDSYVLVNNMSTMDKL